MTIKIIVSPDVEIDVEALIEQWNNSPEAKAVATAQLEEEAAVSFGDPITMTVVLVGIATGVTTGVLTNVLTKAVEKLLWPEKEKPPLKVTPVTMPDGTTMLVVDRG